MRFWSLFQRLRLGDRAETESIVPSTLFAGLPVLRQEHPADSAPQRDLPPEFGKLGGRRWQSLSISLYSATMFLSAVLLFLVEPMFAKMVLPPLGGSAAVWTTCLVFFQVTLLAGYVYAHASANVLGRRAQVTVHVAVLLAGLALLSVHVPPNWTPPPQANPAVWLLRLLFVAVGLPFFALSATAPIL